MKILKILSFSIILVTTFMLITLHDKSDNKLYYDRYYTVIKKDIGSHIHKGKSVIEYYLTVKYDNDPKFNWTSKVTGSKYFSVDAGKKYSTRELIDTKLFVLLFILMVLSVVSISYLLFKYL